MGVCTNQDAAYRYPSPLCHTKLRKFSTYVAPHFNVEQFQVGTYSGKSPYSAAGEEGIPAYLETATIQTETTFCEQ